MPLPGWRPSHRQYVWLMHAREVDQSNERIRIESPLYRVNFWEQPAPGYGWNLDAWLLDECVDVREAIAWARDHATGRRFEVLANVSEERETDQLVRLVGTNPNE